ncbi:hypothetical protein [Gemmobacter nectariphilus]|uniref:hypothetical protein n=1 Tax=Gemmobacter nectariphilus TaxID=220343 RepID=UPI0004098307|nr:hypothetical protein [Gemmobacter nectariphilus]
MPIYATNGAKLYIGGATDDKATDFQASDFAGETWVQIKHTEALGSAGDTAQEITFDTIDRERTTRLKGTRSGGSMDVVCGIDYADAGQIALLAAEKSRENFAFRLVLNDAPTGGTPSERMFIAMVGSAVEAFDTANNVMKLNASLWVNSNVVKVNAAS